MKNKTDYFELFIRQSAYCVQAAELLKSFLSSFDAFRMPETVEEMHRIEHEADEVRRLLTKALFKEFLPPIEREDIMALANELDNVTDTVEDTLRQLYMFNIDTVLPDAIALSDVVLESCRALHRTVSEFRNFKKPDKLQDCFREVNDLEEKGDALYTEAVRTLYCGTNDPQQMLRWTQIFGNLENCCDVCEHASDVMEAVLLKNA